MCFTARTPLRSNSSAFAFEELLRKRPSCSCLKTEVVSPQTSSVFNHLVARPSHAGWCHAWEPPIPAASVSPWADARGLLCCYQGGRLLAQHDTCAARRQSMPMRRVAAHIGILSRVAELCHVAPRSLIRLVLHDRQTLSHSHHPGLFKAMRRPEPQSTP